MHILNCLARPYDFGHMVEVSEGFVSSVHNDVGVETIDSSLFNHTLGETSSATRGAMLAAVSLMAIINPEQPQFPIFSQICHLLQVK